MKKSKKMPPTRAILDNAVVLDNVLELFLWEAKNTNKHTQEIVARLDHQIAALNKCTEIMQGMCGPLSELAAVKAQLNRIELCVSRTVVEPLPKKRRFWFW